MPQSPDRSVNRSKAFSNLGAPNILCISPAFIPNHDSEAFCSAKFVAALSDAGASISVFTSSAFGIADDVSSFWQRSRERIVDFSVPSSRNPVQSAHASLKYQTRVYARWVDAVVNEARRLHQQRPFDLVYSRSLPMFGHIAGYWCAKDLQLPWIANINDPWDWHLSPIKATNRVKFPRALSTLWMKRTFRTADLITYPNNRLHEYQVKVSGIPHDALIIPHVGSAHQVASQTDSTPEDFTLIHAGNLGVDEITGRSAIPLLTGLRQFLEDFPEAAEKTRLVFVGPSNRATTSLISSLRLDKVVSSVGRVTYEESLKFIQSAAVCVLVEAEMKEGIYLPSKLVDYLSARKPVLALSPRVGVIADMTEHFPIVRIDTGDVEAVRRAIGNLYSDFKSGTLSRRAPTPEQARQFDPHYLACEFLEAFHNLGREKKYKRADRFKVA